MQKNHHTLITNEQIPRTAAITGESLSKIARKKEISSLINNWLQLNSNKNLQHIMTQIVNLCIWMEYHTIKMSVGSNEGYIFGSLEIFYDGNLIYNAKNIQNNLRDIPCVIYNSNTFMGTKFKWLPDVIGWAKCDNNMLIPIEGARYINHPNNTMAWFNIFEYYKGKWIKTIPEKGSLVYETAHDRCLYYDGFKWIGTWVDNTYNVYWLENKN
jgi:hypothetical protein